MSPEIISLGEPLLEFNANQTGPLRNVRSYEVGWGGDTSNFAIAVSRLGGDAGYVCRIGDDDFGAAFLALWAAEGVDTSQVIVEPGGKTGIYFISRTADDHQFTYYRQGSAASHFSPADVPEAYLAEAKLVHTSGISQAISNASCDAVFRAVEIARDAGVLVCYDPNVRLKLWDLPRARAIVLETIRQADFVLPSLEDAVLITGMEDPSEIVAWLLSLGPKAVLLKLGAEGALLGSQAGMEEIAGFEVELVDATGAGDTFDAAFAVAYLRGEELADCARFANAAAALVTTGPGAVAPIPRRQQVENLLKNSSPSRT